MPGRNGLKIRPARQLKGKVVLPGDKSLSHRALILAGLADGASRIENCLIAGVTEAMIGCLRSMGVEIRIEGQPDGPVLIVNGRKLHGLIAPEQPLNCNGSATTMRLLAGVMAGQSFPSVLDGNQGLRMRPMDRIVEPLRAKGAHVETADGNAPLVFSPHPLESSRHVLPVASAQVKSALLLAGLYSDGPTMVVEPHPSRDHTERLLISLGAPLEHGKDSHGHAVILYPDGFTLPALNLKLPSDPSSAAFLLVAGLLVSDCAIEISDVCLNPGRIGLFEVLDSMNAHIKVSAESERNGEPTGTLSARSSALKGATVGGVLVTRMIDEFPILAVAATQADGITIVRDAKELRFKETDRIETLAEELGKMGAVMETRPDGFRIRGPVQLKGAVVNGRGDHRIAMSLAVAGLVAKGETVIEGWEIIRESFPEFPNILKQLGADVEC
ncbi:MAG: 3-phosphoshikimate 1-carboxyvinyltransferase [Desulfomonilaceae bacterium]